MAVALIRFADLSPSLWRNKAGRKADIATGKLSPPGWSLGFAWLDADAPFSDFAGHDRTITLLTGPGFTLHFADGTPAIVARTPHQPHRFDGGRPTQCRIAGPSLVLNAMTDRASHTHRVTIATGPATANTAASPADFAVILAGTQITPAGTANPHDTLRLARERPLELPAGTTAALIRFEPSVSMTA
jgi:environmental stress-induced protein Ves